MNLGIEWAMWALWVVVSASIVIVLITIAVNLTLVSMARRGKSGTEYIAMALRPFYRLNQIALLAGAICAALLGAASHTAPARAVLYALTVLFAIWLFGPMAQLLRIRTRSDRVMRRGEMLKLIRAGEIRSFAKAPNAVTVQYWYYYDKKGNYLRRPDKAAGFEDYVAATREASNRSNRRLAR